MRNLRTRLGNSKLANSLRYQVSSVLNNLITGDNSTFDNSVGDWAVGSGDGSIGLNTNRLSIDTGTSGVTVYLDFVGTIGQEYTLSMDLTNVFGIDCTVSVKSETFSAPGSILNNQFVVSTQLVQFTFTPISTNSHITIATVDGFSEILIDNVTITI